MWQVSLVVFFGLFVAQTLVKRNLALSSKVPSTIPPIISYVTGILPLGIIVGLLIRHNVQWSAWTLTLLAIEGSFIGAFNWVSFRALKYLPAAHFQTVFQVSSIIIIALGWLLLSEKLSPLQIVGALFIFASAFLAIWAPVKAHKNGQKRPKTVFVLLA